MPRLAPSDNPITVDVTVSAKLRPYFTEWYQASKKEDDTPSSFLLDLMKREAVRYYKSVNLQAEVEAVELNIRTLREGIQEDAVQLYTEINE